MCFESTWSEHSDRFPPCVAGLSLPKQLSSHLEILASTEVKMNYRLDGIGCGNGSIYLRSRSSNDLFILSNAGNNKRNLRRDIQFHCKRMGKKPKPL